MEHSTTRKGDRMRQGRPPLVILLLATLLTATVVSARSGSAQVECVIDGDTIRVRMDGARDTVRLTGVDTPETTHPTVGVEPFGPEAFAYTTARLTGATVRLDLDPAAGCGTSCSPAASTSTRPSSAKGTPWPFGRFSTPVVKSF